MKKKVLIAGSILLCFIVFSLSVVLYLNPNWNILKLKAVENNALEYISATYPSLHVSEISVHHEWKSNHYVVNYKSADNEERALVYDHTGEQLFHDAYISIRAFEIVNAYQKSIEEKIETVLQNHLGVKASYIIVEDKNVFGKEREIVLNGLDISNDSVQCTIGLVGSENAETIDFARLSKDIFAAVFSAGLPVKELNITQQNSPGSRFDINCPANMGQLTAEEINDLVKR